MNKQEMINAAIARYDSVDDTNLITDWLNEGYLILAKVAKLYTEGTVTANSSYRLYSLPNTLIQLLGVKCNGKFLEKIDEDQADGRLGVPSYYFKRGNKLGFYPMPETDTVIDILYYEYPDKLINDSDSPVIPEEYHGAIINFAISRAMESEEEFDAAQYYRNQFEVAKNELKQAANNDDTAPRKIKDVYGVI